MKAFTKAAQFPSSTQLRGFVPRKEAGRLSLLEHGDIGEKTAGAFIDEMRKIAQLPTAPPPTPEALTQTKSTTPNKPTSGKIPTYTKNNSEVLESPARGLQPLAQPPPVRR
jgi:hypothetical protein